MKIITTSSNFIDAHLSEDKLIKFNLKTNIVILTSIILFILLIFFKINYSSMHYLAHYIKGIPTTGILLGQAKGIRIDEWGKRTPGQIMALANSDFKVNNRTLGGKNFSLLLGLPVSHFSSIFRPQYWGLLALDIARGFAYFWNYKLFGLFLSTFLLLLLLTGNHFAASFLGSLWIFFSPFIQWWFSTTLVQMLIAFNCIIVASIYLLVSKNRFNIIFSFLILNLYLMAFPLYLYPPFQIPLVYLAIFIFIGFLKERLNLETLKTRIVYKIPLVILTLLITPTILYLFYKEAKEVIHVMSNTIYPGMRRSNGGGINFVDYFGGFYDMFFSNLRIPWGGNICQANNFIYTFPLLLVCAIKNLSSKRRDYFHFYSIMLFLILFFCWQVFGLPEYINNLLLLNRVPVIRSLIGMGVGTMLATIIYLSNDRVKRNHKKAFCIIMVCCVAGLLLYQSTFILKIKFFTTSMVTTVVLLFSLLTYFIIKNKVKLFFLFLLPAIIIPNFPVNPIVQGMDPFFKSKIYKFLNKIKKEDPHAHAVFYSSDWVRINFLKSAGIESVFGSYPDLDMYYYLDPEKKYEHGYNRGGQIVVIPLENKDEFKAEVGHSRSYFKLFIHPCAPKLEKIGAKYVIMDSKYFKQEYLDDCLIPITEKPIDGILVFKRKEKGARKLAP